MAALETAAHPHHTEANQEIVIRAMTMTATMQDLLLTPGSSPVDGDGVHAEHVLQPRIVLAETVRQDADAGLGHQRRVQ
jgi:hypothetical protein